MYPFGKEEAASLERLFWFFSECVQRGDWELARACVPQLQQLQDHGSEKVEKILHALIICPSHLRSESKHSPQKLAWFWLLVLQEWLSHKQKTVPVALQRETEFLLLLEELEKDVPFVVLKELYESFEDNHLLHRKQRDGSVQKFGVEVMSALQKMLLQAPRKLQAILELLQRDPVECSSSVIQSGLPQNVFVGFLWDSLRCLKRLQLNPELLEREGNKVADEIYNALSMLNLKGDNQTRELRLLCRELLDACWVEKSPLREERLLSCMLRKDSHALLSLFGSVFIEKMKEKLLSQKSPGKGTPEHPEAERAVMALFLDHEQACSWKAAYFYYLSSHKHFLEQILGFYSDSVLKDFCDGLCAQVEVLEWCIQQNSNCIPEKVLLQHLHSLECHSSLYLLYQLTDLLALNEEAVIELFQKTPAKYGEVQDLLEFGNCQETLALAGEGWCKMKHELSHFEIKTISPVSWKKTKGISGLEDEGPMAVGFYSAVMPDVRLLSQQHNLTLYQASCAMKYATYALCVKAHRGSNCRHCANYFVTELPNEPLERNEFPSQPLYPETDYASLFPHYLSKCQNYLRSIPAPLRLELLENIFSLLFVSSHDLYGDSLQEDNAEDAGFRKKSHLGKRTERCTSQDSSTSPSPQHTVSPERRAHVPTCSAHQEYKGSQTLLNLESKSRNCDSFGLSYLDLKHFTSNISGFLVDEEALEIFLKMLMEHLKEIEDSFVWDSRHVPTLELALLDSLNLSINRENFNIRVQQFSKYLSEAQWRHRIVLNNKNTGSHRGPTRINYNLTKASFLKKHTQSQRQKPEYKRTSDPSLESSSSELRITSTSEGSASASSDCSDAEYWIKPSENSLIPAMLSPPESLLVACILRGNYIEAHQVAVMFDLETSASYGELIFLERYQEVIGELAKVEHKIEHQSSEGSGNLKQTGSGRSTLQAIGNAAAAGMVFYSISDVTDKLLAPSESLAPVLQENFWTSSVQLECTDPLNNILEDLCPSAMAIFDLATTQCNLWKTCKQLLETAERKLQNSLEIKGRRLDSNHQNPDGLKGFPAVLQQISKIINTPLGQPKSDSKGSVLASLVEQAFLKPAELEAHPVCGQIKHLLKILDQYAVIMQEGYRQTAYVQTFFDYINKLAAIIFRSLTPEIDQSADIQVGNPFILLQQSPSHLLSQLLFEKQIAPDRLSSLLAKEELNLNVQQVIIKCCCKALPLYINMQSNQTRSLLTNISSLAHLYAYHCLPDIEVPVRNPAMESENTSNNPISSLSDINQHSLTASTLNFLKSQSKLLATMACLTALKVQKPLKQSLSWIEFRGKREAPLSMDQISKECEMLLKEFPFLESFLLAMCEPLQEPQDKGIGLASELCGKSYISLLFLGLHSSLAIEVLMETFEQALTARDWPRALKILDFYSQDMQELVTVRDAVLSCATAEDEDGWQYLFPVRDAMLRSRLALRCLDRWPLEACLEILAYCAYDPEILRLQTVHIWHDWQDLKRTCTEDPQAIVAMILEAKDYELCEEWGRLYSIPRDHLISLHQEHLLHLLEMGDMEKALQLLQRIDDPDIQFVISERCLDTYPSLAASHFLADYLTTYFNQHLTVMRQNEIQALYVGSKVLLTLPEPSRSNYSHLSCKPLLMLEQLLMNMKVDWAAVAVQMLHQLLVDSLTLIRESLSRGSESDTLSKSESTEHFPASCPDTAHASNSREKSLQQAASVQDFVPPEKPPSKQQWIPDDTEVTCMVCKTERFTMVIEFQNWVSNEEDQNQEAVESSDNECPDYSAVVQIPKPTEFEWQLSLMEEDNKMVRSEFFYEQAPSASLCIAIFKLHSDSIACGQQLIDYCCKLSRNLANPEVDAGLLIDIMKQLLFSAKMMFVTAGRSQELALCDSYLSKVDVLNILVAAAYRHVPSLDQILEPAAVSRLRNQLLQAEYYQLSVEVSTKTGLDPGGAWHAWGMACLKAGNLTAAREKFSRCLKSPLDLNQLSLGSHLVQEVLQYLETTVKPVLSVDDDYLATLRELEATLRTRSLSLEMTPEGKMQHNSYYQECLFYLHNYGTNLAIISFYMRHDCMREALLHLLNKESPPDVFIEGIFIPSYKSGKLHMLENLLETIDPGLESWGVYLIAACKHLQKKNYYHILYEVQQFMKDQVRAAMTCIRFFTDKAKSYTELKERQKWLLKVKDHLKVYLQEVSRSSGRKKFACSFRKKMSAPDVSRHISTVELQMEVTKFLHRCEKSGSLSIGDLPMPTLFGNNQMKIEVACKVMLEGKNIEEGFGIAFRILQLVKQQSYSEIRQLIKCIKESGAADKNDGDNVILSCLDEFDSIPAEELDNLIQDMDSDENKIQAYLKCHKLRSAYLISVKQENIRAVQLVQHIRQMAEDGGDDVVQAICTQWLLVHHTKPRSWLTQNSKK
ncbi:hypothetical protein Chor_016604 [Crotalus horridus]